MYDNQFLLIHNAMYVLFYDNASLFMVLIN